MTEETLFEARNVQCWLKIGSKMYFLCWEKVFHVNANQDTEKCSINIILDALTILSGIIGSQVQRFISHTSYMKLKFVQTDYF
jgi:hypothetical protein